MPINKQIRIKCIVLGSSGAGKTSFLRRFFHKTFEDERKSTICADFYSSIQPNPLYKKVEDDGGDSNYVSKTKSRDGNSKKHKKKKKKKSDGDRTTKKTASSTTNTSTNTTTKPQNEEIPQKPFVALQMWDTAGKERLLSEDSAGLTSRLGDAFFRHVNVAILIYDATSSRSFLQLIKWHSELLERISRVQFEGSGGGGANSSTGASSARADYDMAKRIRFGRRFPVLVVATKLDRLKAEQSKSGNVRTVPQRNVMGLQRGFKGMDYHYEYTVFHGTNTDMPNDNKSSGASSLSKKEERMSLSYGLEVGCWANDKSYMDYVRIAEDECFPDRTMVKRWCRRNGLLHLEVSALEGKGIDVAVETMVALALKDMNEQQTMEAAISNGLYAGDGVNGSSSYA